MENCLPRSTGADHLEADLPVQLQPQNRATDQPGILRTRISDNNVMPLFNHAQSACSTAHLHQLVPHWKGTSYWKGLQSTYVTKAFAVCFNCTDHVGLQCSLLMRKMHRRTTVIESVQERQMGLS